MRKTNKLAGFLFAALCLSTPVKAADVINAYSVMPEKYAAQIAQAYEQKTGVKINFVRMASGEALARLNAERGNPQVDVLLGGPSDMYEAGIKTELFEAYTPKDTAVPEQYRSAKGYWTGFGLNPLVFMTNTKFLEKNNLKAPESWQDLLDPAYKNGLQMADARTSGTATERIFSLVKLYGEDGAFDYQKKLHKNVQLYTKSGQGGAMPVAAGQAASGIFYFVDALDVKQQGYPVVITYPKEGITSGIDCFGIIHNAKNMDAAKKFIDWASSVELANLIMEKKINYVPVAKGANITDPVLDLSNVKILEADSEWKGAKRKEYVERWVKEVIQ
ncbi:ABC transporter substrate-binding protein [Microvirga sp. W0021]|uniref:ABC transporter substrate-binding protein n=1 Tax=Hohaiivirga grylli TaxID=3133970 RepID=A0ABV0BFL6_9HYPH